MEFSLDLKPADRTGADLRLWARVKKSFLIYDTAWLQQVSAIFAPADRTATST